MKLHKYLFCLLFLWIFVTAFNLFKPIHMDDTAYIETAQWIAANSLHPMSGMLNWDNASLPIHNENFPLAFSYILAVTIKLFGASELAFHVVVSLFVLASIFVFYRLLAFFVEKNRILLTYAFFASPFYMPSQNVMLDIPTLFLWLLFYLFLLDVKKFNNKYAYYGILGLIIFLACLFKYASIILIPILLLVMILRKDYRQLPMIVIPIIGLVGWSLFNYWDYGGIHLFSIKDGPTSRSVAREIKASLSWMAILGSMLPLLVPFGLSYFFNKIRHRDRGFWTMVILAFSAIIIPVFFLHENLIMRLLYAFFLINGLMLLVVFYKEIIFSFILKLVRGFVINEKQLILLLWFFSGFGFIIIFAPFLAVRHIILVMPPVMFAIGIYVEKLNKIKLMRAGTVLTIFLAIIISIADFQYASVYKTYAQKISHEYAGSSSIWFLGHWGWQWYAKQNGLLQYDSTLSKIKSGDIIISPQLLGQSLTREDQERVTLINKIDVPLRYFGIIRTMAINHAGGYYSCGDDSCFPWFPDGGNQDSFLVFRVN